jgi:diguanylate cyclase (GGDEF)-like protein
MPYESLAIEDHFAGLLTTLGEAVQGTASVVFVATDERGTWTAPKSGDLVVQMATLVEECLDHDGPWGLRHLGAADEWAVWIEETEVREDVAPGALSETDAVRIRKGRRTGALGVAKRARPEASAAFSDNQVRAIRVVASLCASAAGISDMTKALEHQRQIEELVSQIAERLMSTTLETMQSSLDWTVETLSRYLKADTAFLRRNDHVNDVSILLSEYPQRDAPDPDPLAVVSFDADPIFAASRDLKAPMVIRHPEEVDVDYTKRVEEARGIVSFSIAGVPLVYGDVTEGCLAFVRFSILNWAEHEISALRMVASLLVHLTHRLEMAENWRLRALTDELTGLANRRALLAEVDRRRPTAVTPLKLIFLDLDRFKVMNDYLGHGVGDKVLATIADRIRDSIKPGDFAARLGGDEFVILLGQHDEDETAETIAEDLLELISQPTVIEGMEIVHSGSIGIAISTDDGHTAEELLSRADIALYAAKRRGRNQHVVFDDTLQAQVAERSNTELMLRQAFADQQNFADHEHLVVYFQPEYDLIDGRMTAVEALVRWNHPIRGLLAAGEFIPVAEETHLMADLGRWVLQQCCTQMAGWRAEYPGLDIVLRVNMSPTELAVPGFVGRVRDVLRETGLPAEVLCLEITEDTAIINVEQTVRMLRELRALGVQLAIDDFGSGYSSMIQLKNLPVNVLKIDRVFVDGIATDLTNQGIVESIIRLSAAFELEVVAEGIETRADMEELIRLGCRRSQGFLLSTPLPAHELVPLLQGPPLDLAALTDWTPSKAPKAATVAAPAPVEAPAEATAPSDTPAP